MSAMTDLIAQIDDPRLRERLTQEWAAVTKEKKFGLVSDPHLPELLPLTTNPQLDALFEAQAASVDESQ